MLHDFIVENREEIIRRAQQLLRARTVPNATEAKLEHGIPLFLSQLVDALVPESSPVPNLVTATNESRAGVDRRMGDGAALHGHDLLIRGYTVAQVVHGYCDVCRVVTELASATKAPISIDDFRVFTRCLEDAVARAVTAYANQRERDLSHQGTERLGVLAHELRTLLGTAILSFDAIKRGMVSLGGSTAVLHARSLFGLSALVERSLAEVSLNANLPALERVSVAEFMQEIEVSAATQAQGCGLHLTITTVDSDVSINVDRQLLLSAVANLLQNAFEFTRAEGNVSLAASATTDRVFLSVSDECGGLVGGKAEELLRPFPRGDSPRSGLRLKLSIALSAARANLGDIHARNVPGTGCVFTIDLPRHPPLSA